MLMRFGDFIFDLNKIDYVKLKENKNNTIFLHISGDNIPYVCANEKEYNEIKEFFSSISPDILNEKQRKSFLSLMGRMARQKLSATVEESIEEINTKQ